MFCPRCRSEYEPGIVVCAECGVKLVDVLPMKRTEKDEEYVPLQEVTDPDLLPVLKSVLDAAGIPFLIQGEEAQGLFPFPGSGANMLPASLGAIIQVPQDRLEEARDLLETVATPTDPESSDSSR